MRIIISIGRPRSGKGSQMDSIFQYLKIKYPSATIIMIIMGDIFRRYFKESGFFTETTKQKSEKGELVVDYITDSLFFNEIKNVPEDAILLIDGYPRTKKQLAKFTKFMKKYGVEDITFFHLEVSAETVKERFLKPKIKELIDRTERGDDKNKKIIEKRLREYDKLTAPMIIEIIKHNPFGQYFKIDGEPNGLQGISQSAISELKQFGF